MGLKRFPDKEEDKDDEEVKEEEVEEKVEAKAKAEDGKVEGDILRFSRADNTDADALRVLFFPSYKEKHITSETVRIREDEGLFTGQPTSVAPWNLARTRQRLSSDQSYDVETGKGHSVWLMPGGEINYLPQSIHPIPMRPGLWHDATVDHMQTESCRAIRRQMATTSNGKVVLRHQTGSEERRRYQLDVDVSSVIFKEHPFISKEEFLAEQLRSLWIQYREASKLSFEQFHEEKLEALLKEVDRMEHMSVGGVLSDARTPLRSTQPTSPMSPSVRLSKSASLFQSHSMLRQTQSTDLFEERLALLRTELKKTRQLRDMEENQTYLMVKSMIKLWKELKAERRRQGFTLTSLKMIFTRIEADEAADLVRQAENIAMLLEEKENQVKREHEQLMVDYERKKELYESERLEAGRREAHRDSIIRRRDRARRQSEGVEDEESDVNPDKDPIEPHGLEPRPATPVLPPFDSAQARSELEALHRSTHRPPGHPYYQPALIESEQIRSNDSQLTLEEKERRKLLTAYSTYHVRVLVGSDEVAQTRALTLKPGCTELQFGEIVQLQLTSWPERVGLRIMRKASGALAAVKLGTVWLSVPDASNRSKENDKDYLRYQLVTEETGFRYYGESTEPEVLSILAKEQQPASEQLTIKTAESYLQAVVVGRCEWASNERGVPLLPPDAPKPTHLTVSSNAAAAAGGLGGGGGLNMALLRRWLKEEDPNDPRNSALVTLMRAAGAHEEGSGMFRVAQQERDLAFVQTATKPSLRHQLIVLRNLGILASNEPIPAYDSEIRPEMFRQTTDEARAREEEHQKTSGGRMSHFMREARKQDASRRARHKRPMGLGDIVSEQALPDVKIAIGAIASIFEKKRPLRPPVKERRPVAAHPEPGECKLLVQVIRAFHVPTRGGLAGEQMAQSISTPMRRGARGLRGFSTAARAIGIAQGMSKARPSTDEKDSDDSDDDVALAAVFVEVAFQEHIARTGVADGSSPVWNETLRLTFRPPDDDFTTQNLRKVSDDICFNLFDESFDALPVDQRDHDTIHQRRERRFLGTFRLPFQTLYENLLLEGNFEVERPVINLAYNIPGSSEAEAEDETPSFGPPPTLLQLHLTLDPALPKPDSVVDEWSVQPDDKKLVRYARAWTKKAKGAHKDRVVQATGADARGNAVFVCRYIGKQRPPEGVTSMEQMSRFVSLIPFLEDASTFEGRSNLWATSEQFLSMGFGDWEEHAILLCNFFLSAGRDAYVVLGSGVPEGETAYVLTRDWPDMDQHTFWNASTGKRYLSRDPNIPLRSIGCIFNNQDVWANIGSSGDPGSISFRLGNTKQWKPFFSKEFPHDPELTKSVQTLNIPFTLNADAKLFAHDLEERLRMTLTRCMERWRTRFVTRWNATCARELRKLLERLEADVSGDSVDLEGAHRHQLERQFIKYTITGFPFELPWTDEDHVVEALYNTAAHATEDPDVEFALSVHVVPYLSLPDSSARAVCAVWVYAAQLRTKRV